MVIRWGEIWTVCWVGEMLKCQFSNHFNGCSCHMRLSNVIIQNNSIWKHFSAFTVNNRFQLLSTHSTILSMILVKLKDGPIKVSKQCHHHFDGRRHTFEFLGPGWWYASTPCFDICLQVHSGAPMFYCLWKSICRKASPS